MVDHKESGMLDAVLSAGCSTEDIFDIPEYTDEEWRKGSTILWNKIGLYRDRISYLERIISTTEYPSDAGGAEAQALYNTILMILWGEIETTKKEYKTRLRQCMSDEMRKMHQKFAIERQRIIARVSELQQKTGSEAEVAALEERATEVKKSFMAYLSRPGNFRV